MKLLTQRNLLNLATTRAHGAISDRSMSQIGLQAKGNILSVAATDRVLAIYSQLDCQIEKEGTLFVPGKLFSSVVKELPEGDVLLEANANFLVIRAGGDASYTMKLPLIEDINWKEPPKIKTTNVATVSSAKLMYMIDQTQICIQSESPRNYGSVGYLHKPEKGKLRIVGTDGFRLSYCDSELDLPEDFLPEGICLSKRALSELLRMSGEGFESLSLAVSEDGTTLLASTDNYKIFIRLSAVKYPKYQGVLPTANLNPIRLDRNHVQNVAKRVLLAADKTNALQLSFSDSSLTLSSKTAGSSESKEALVLEDFRSPGADLSVNGKFLTDVFSTVASEELTLQFKSKDDPIVIIPREEPSDCRSMHVLVPIREHV